MTDVHDPGSFRDPSGFVFRDEVGVLYRQVNHVFLPALDQLDDSGCYDALLKERLLVPHERVGLEAAAQSDTAAAILRPHEIPFVSYPYEWCFAQLRDAALTTLRAQEVALDHGMTLRDASAFNVQFDGSRAVLIDTLSFGPYEKNTPWVAYRQFCMHFLAPLAALAYGVESAALFLRTRIEGLPLHEAARMLPWFARLKPGLLIHLVLHARATQRYERTDGASKAKTARVSEAALRGTIQSLRRAVDGLPAPARDTHWSGYYADNSYAEAATHAKDAFVRGALQAVQPRMVWDLGTNTGRYARMAAEAGAYCVALDYDAGCVGALYDHARGGAGVLPLQMDLSNPSPALGWAHAERKSLLERGPADLALALALVHHLAIGNNVPLPMVANFLSRCARQVVVEWVPKGDPMVQQLLASREDVFPAYTEEGFVTALERHFVVKGHTALPSSGRVLFHLEARR